MVIANKALSVKRPLTQRELKAILAIPTKHVEAHQEKLDKALQDTATHKRDERNRLMDLKAQHKAENGSDLISDVLLQVYHTLLGREAYEAAESIDPKRVKIPREQAMCILDAVARCVPVQDGNHAQLVWLNIGPSSYDEGDT